MKSCQGCIFWIEKEGCDYPSDIIERPVSWCEEYVASESGSAMDYQDGQN